MSIVLTKPVWYPKGLHVLALGDVALEGIESTKPVYGYCLLI